MRRILLLLALTCLFASANYGQSASPKAATDDNAVLERFWLLADLQALDAKAVKLDATLARALAKADSGKAT